MKAAVMQPYFLPYIGYFQLMAAVDRFVVYDNIQYTKKGWINRNRFLSNGKDEYFTLPLKKDSDFLDVKERHLADSGIQDLKKMLGKLKQAYQKAPYFKEVFPVLEKIFSYYDQNLFGFIYNSIYTVKAYLEMDCELIVSSEIRVDHTLKAQQKVIAICEALHADAYYNLSGGIDLYDAESFKNAGTDLIFIKSDEIKYEQFSAEFVPWLSIIDVLMFNSKATVQKYLTDYTIINP